MSTLENTKECQLEIEAHIVLLPYNYCYMY